MPISNLYWVRNGLNMEFVDIEKHYEDLWIYHLISYKEFVEDSRDIPFNTEYPHSSLPVFQKFILREMEYYIYSLAGLIDKANDSMNILFSTEDFKPSIDPLIKYFMIGIELWQEYVVSSNNDLSKFKIMEETSHVLYNQIYDDFIKKKPDYLKYLSPFYAIFGTIYRKYGYYSEARKLLVQGVIFSLKVGSPLYICISYLNLREFYEDMVDLQKALDYAFLSKEKLQELNKPIHEAYITTDIGWLNFKMGNVGDAIKSFENAIELYQLIDGDNLSKMNGLISCYNQLGRIFCSIGNLDEGFFKYTKALELYRSISGRTNHTLLSNLGEYYNFKGDYQNSLKFQIEALQIKKKRDFSSSNQIPLAESYFHLIKLYIHFKDYAEANKYLLALKEIHDTWLDKVISAQYRISSALLLKENRTMTNLVLAQEILSGIVKEPMVSLELSSTALVTLIDIKLLEYKFFHNQENLSQLRDLIEDLNKFTQKSKLMQVKILILRAKLEIVEGSLEMAETLFVQSLELAELYNLVDLIGEVKNEMAKLNDEIFKAKKLLTTNISIKERIEESEIEKYVSDIQEILSLFRD